MVSTTPSGTFDSFREIAKEGRHFLLACLPALHPSSVDLLHALTRAFSTGCPLQRAVLTSHKTRHGGHGCPPKAGRRSRPGRRQDAGGQALSGSNTLRRRVIHRFGAPTTGKNYRIYYRGIAVSLVAAGFQRCSRYRLCVNSATVYA